jgi:hypothetical protein
VFLAFLTATIFRPSWILALGSLGGVYFFA